ncbi:hypothetical protein ACJX0J_029328, partial [Zea mays]
MENSLIKRDGKDKQPLTLPREATELAAAEARRHTPAIITRYGWMYMYADSGFAQIYLQLASLAVL